MEQNELMHYGVIGMKWGVHKGNVAQAYDRATEKRKKLENRVVKTKSAYDKATIKANTGASKRYKNLQAKADKFQYKADKKKYGFFTNASKAAKLQSKADAMQYKANKYKYRYEKREAKRGVANARYVKAQRKAEKWIRSMDEVFKDYDINNLPSGNVDSGKEFIKRVS